MCHPNAGEAEMDAALFTKTARKGRKEHWCKAAFNSLLTPWTCHISTAWSSREHSPAIHHSTSQLEAKLFRRARIVKSFKTLKNVAWFLKFQAYESGGVVTSRGMTWNLPDKQNTSRCTKIYLLVLYFIYRYIYIYIFINYKQINVAEDRNSWRLWAEGLNR